MTGQKHILGIGEYAITRSPQDALITYALGSCLAILIYCPQKHMAGMAHIALPERLSGGLKHQHKPAYFADEAVPLLLAPFEVQRGYRADKLQVHLIGGAVSRFEKDPFQVGQRNLEKVKALLRYHGLRYTAVDVGGHLSRTVEFDLGTTALVVKTQAML